MGQPLKVQGCRILEVAFSPDGKKLASSGTNNCIFVWDVTTGTQIVAPLIGHTNWVRGLAFHPDGQTLVSSDIDGMVITWNIAKAHILTGHKNRVRSVALSPDGDTLVTSSFDKHLQIWDAHTLACQMRILTPHHEAIMCLAFSPDGRFLATGGAKGRMVIWGTDNWQPVGELPIYQESVLISITFSPDSQWVAVGDFGGNVVLYNLHVPERVCAWQTFENSWTLSLAFSPDGTTLAAGSANGSIHFYDCASLSEATAEMPHPCLSPIQGHTNWVTDLLFTPDGNQLVSASSDSTIRIWDVATGQAAGDPILGHTHQVWKLTFDQSQPSPTLVSLDNQGNVFWWDWEKRTLDRPILRTGIETECMALSPKGDAIYMGTFENTARVWPIDTRPWCERASDLARRQLTLEEWRQFLPNMPY